MTKKNQQVNKRKEKTKKIVKISVTIIMALAIVLSGIIPFIMM